MALFFKARPMPDVAGNAPPTLETMSVDALVALKLQIEQLLAPRVHDEIAALTAKLASLKNSFGIAGGDLEAVKKKRRKRRKSSAGGMDNDIAAARD